MGTRLWTTVTAAVAGALAAGALLAVTSGGGGQAVPQASAQAGFTVSAGQLRINQRISQASVRRSNRALNYLAPIRTAQTDAADDGRSGVRPLGQIAGSGQGWTTGQIANGAITEPKVGDGAITTSKLADGSVTSSKLASPPLFATVAPATAAATVVRGSGATAVARVAVGFYEVTFNRDVTGCTWLATYGQPDNSGVDARWATTRGRPDNTRVGVVIRDPVGGQVDGQGFHLQVLCP